MIIGVRVEPIIIASNVEVEEPGIAVWSNASTYNIFDEVQSLSTNSIYKAIQAVPADIDPAVDAGNEEGVGIYWYRDRLTNYKRAFDALSSSRCSNAEEIYYKFETSDIDLLMLSGLSAYEVQIKVTNTDANITLLDETYSLTTREVYDWSDWTYNILEKQSSFFKTMPLSFNTTLEIWIRDVGNTPSVGHIAFARSQQVGLTLIKPQPTTSRRGVTTKTRDKFGNIKTRRKARYKRMSVTCLIDSSSIDIIEDRLEKIVDMPCIFVGDERDGGYKALLIYGEMKDHDMPISVSKTSYRLQVEGYL